MWIWIIIGIAVIYWIYDLVRNVAEHIVFSGNRQTKLILVAIVAACAFGLLLLITGWGIMSILAKLSLVAAVILAVMRLVSIIFEK